MISLSHILIPKHETKIVTIKFFLSRSLFQVSYHRIFVLVILSALIIAVSAIAMCLWCSPRPSRVSGTIVCFRNACLAEAHSEVPVAEESILISCLERNDVL